MNQALVKVMISEAVRIVTIPFRIIPIKHNRILFTGLTGGKNYDYSCNPRYVYEYLRDRYPGQYEYVWAVSDKKKYAFLEEEGVKLVQHFTVSSFPMLLTAKVVVTNGSYAPWFPFRKKQYVINTWHGGGAYKKVENDRPDANRATRKRARFCAENIDLFVASCKTQEEQMIRKTYQYTGEVLKKGTPRNDKLVRKETKQMEERVRAFYHIPEKAKIILYAPTYRYGTIPVVLNCDRLLNQLERNGETWFFLNRYHRYQTENMNVHVEGMKGIDVMEYPDMQELLAAADVLITDYSSCVWDYAFLERPCVLYVPDKQEYISHTGFYVAPDEWPFPQADSQDTLVLKIEQLLYDDMEREHYLEAVKHHLHELDSYESGQATEEVAKWIEHVTNATNGKRK